MAHIHLGEGSFPLWALALWTGLGIVLISTVVYRVRKGGIKTNQIALAGIGAAASFAIFQLNIPVWGGIHMNLPGLVGILAGFHRFMDRAARPGSRSEPEPEAAATDGGTPTFPWLQTADRWIVTYEDASDAIEGLVAMGGLTVLTITFAALFTAEYLTLARTQFFGIYTFGMFMSLTGLTVSYYAWFMPHVEVAERRDH